MQISITPNEIKKMETCITTFMTDRNEKPKKIGELLEIFNNCHKDYSPDHSNDLRIIKYTEDMSNDNWTGNIILTSQNRKITDGIHRGIAWLRCIDGGINKDKLPKLIIESNNSVLDTDI